MFSDQNWRNFEIFTKAFRSIDDQTMDILFWTPRIMNPHMTPGISKFWEKIKTSQTALDEDSLY